MLKEILSEVKNQMKNIIINENFRLQIINKINCNHIFNNYTKIYFIYFHLLQIDIDNEFLQGLIKLNILEQTQKYH